VTTARRVVPVTRDGDTGICDVPVAFENDIRADVRVERACHRVTDAGNAATAVAHRVGCGYHITAVVGPVAESDEIDDGIVSCCFLLAHTGLPNRI
jgi:hypothetical protein